MTTQDPTPTDEDRARVQYAIDHPRETVIEALVLNEARQRVRREREDARRQRSERRRRRLNRISFGLLARE
jgi:hypothetical protein